MKIKIEVRKLLKTFNKKYRGDEIMKNVRGGGKSQRMIREREEVMSGEYSKEMGSKSKRLSQWGRVKFEKIIGMGKTTFENKFFKEFQETKFENIAGERCFKKWGNIKNITRGSRR